MVMVIVGILATGAVFNAVTSQSVAANDRNGAYAQYMAESGLNHFKTIAFQGYKFFSENKDQYVLTDSQKASIRCAGGNLLAVGLDLDRKKNAEGKYEVDIWPDAQPHLVPVTLPDGTLGGYEISIRKGGDELISQGFVGGTKYDTARAKATSALLFTVGGAGPFNNAIFVKGGFFGPAINGNVSVYGSIHSINGNIKVGDPALSLGGTAGVYNDYQGEGSNSDVRATIAELGGNKDLADLCSSIKLKSGNLDIESGSVSVARAGNKAKGIYLDPRFKITGPTTNIHVETPKLVSLYNSSLDVPFPELPENFPGDEPNGVTLSPATCPKLFSSTTLTVPPPDPNASTTFTCTLGVSPNTHTVKWTPGSGTGSSAVPGYLTFTPPAGQKDTIINTGLANINITGNVAYEGKAIFRAGNSKTDTTRNIQIDGNLIPRGGGYPETNALAFASSGTINTTTSQLKIAALLYSQKSTTISKQSVILGSVVAETINLGEQVPSIAYQPGIEKAFSTLPGYNPSTAAVPTPSAYERR